MKINTYIHTYTDDTCFLTLYSGLDAILSDSVEMDEDTYREKNITS